MFTKLWSFILPAISNEIRTKRTVYQKLDGFKSNKVLNNGQPDRPRMA